jgi:F-type H+-transporting ATPase subunit b
METFMAIFTQLGVDSSLVHQFVIILVVFIIAQFLFLGKLQNVIETREEKTTKLESNADETILKVQRMQNEYKNKIEDASRSALKNSAEKKQQIVQKYSDQYKQAEKEVNSYVDQSRNDFKRDVDANKEKYLKEAEALSESLVQKILQ